MFSTPDVGTRQHDNVKAAQWVVDMQLEHSPLAPAVARREARRVLTARGVDEDQIYDTLLVVSELVTNAVTHALPPVALHLRVAGRDVGRIQVHVSDGGPQLDPTTWAATRPEDEHGRGAAIISALVDSGGSHSTPEDLIDHWADLAAA
ncbi:MULTISPECIES: ATP-binding protein [unclassified Streptomyces]|uniref:ATP-binding protein n=1 Tax=unclassified Streptomyces TaxID=2593676 RepID=UPI0033BD6D8A